MRRKKGVSSETASESDAGFHLIDDRPIDDASSDTLEYGSISAAISRIVVLCDPPYTIGLFGSWGVGKTSITNMVIEHLSDNRGEVASVKLDVWKYEQDSLRGQLLLETLRQLKDAKLINPAYSLNERLEKTVSHTTTERRRLDWPTFWTEVFPYALVLAVTAVVSSITSATRQPLSGFLSSLTAASAALFIGTFLKDLFEHVPLAYRTTERTETQDRIEDPQGFEAEFKKLLRSCSADRVLIVIDNLDRCSARRCKELLSTLKTFLEPDSEKCVFLLTCDEGALKEQINHSDREDADEYLRKFFNVVVRVPQPISSDLQAYARDILKSTKIKEFDSTSDLASVIISGYRRNPRQIKQFVNSLVGAYLVAREREEDNKALPEGAVTQNPVFLAKTLIIQDRWPVYYEQFQRDPTILVDPLTDEENSLYPGLRAFLSATAWVKTDDPQDFINLKRSEVDRRLHGLDNLLRETLEEGGDSKAIEEIADKLRDKNVPISDIELFVVEIYGKSRIGRARVNTLSAFSSVASQLNYPLTPDFCDSVSVWLTEDFSAELSSVPAELTFTAAKSAHTAGKRRLLASIGKEIGSMGLGTDSTSQVCGIAFLVEARTSKEFLIANGIDIPLLVLQWNTWPLAYVEELARDPDWCKQIAVAENRKVPKSLIERMIADLIPGKDPDEFAKHRLDYANSVVNVLTDAEPHVAEDFLEHLCAIATSQTSWSAAQRQIILKSVGENLERASVLPSPDPQRQNMAVQTVQHLISGISDASILEIACTVMTYLDEGATESTKQNATKVAQQFLNQGNSVGRQSFLQRLNEKQWKWLFDNAKDILLGHGSETQDIFDLLWKYRTDEAESGLIESSLTNGHYMWLEKANSDSPIHNRASATKQLLDRLSSPRMPVPEQTGLVALVNDLACGDDGANQKRLADSLKEALCSTSLERQTMAVQGTRDASRYMSDVLMNDVVTPSLQSLDSRFASNPTTAPGYESVNPILEAAAPFAKQLSGGQQLNILGILFERYLRTSSDPIVIANVFSTVAAFNFKKKTLRGYQEKVETRIRTETDENIKVALREGLQKLGLNQPGPTAEDPQ